MIGSLRSVTRPRPEAADRPQGHQGAAATGAWGHVVALVTSKSALSLADQAVVSGTNFLTTVLVGRWCGAQELGVYALGFSLQVFLICVQDSLINGPYTIYRTRSPRGTPAEDLGSTLAHQALLSAVAVLALAAVGACLAPPLAAVAWTLAAVLPFILLREFGRRVAFAHLRMAEALVLDLVVAVAQLIGLPWLASVGALSAASAFAAIGVACALVGVTWLSLKRRNFVLRWGPVWANAAQNWSLGKWLFASQVTYSIQGYFIHWLLAWMLGATATGIYAACLTVALFANPIILGIGNAFTPRACLAFTEGGSTALRSVVWKTFLLTAVIMGVFCTVVLAGGTNLMALLYRGGQYEGHDHALVALVLAVLMSALGMPAANGLAAIERPDLSFKVGVLVVVLSVLLVPWLVAAWGLTGAAYGFLAGHLLGAGGRWLAFLARLREVDRDALPVSPCPILEGETP
jgi:O-antigen/teichoic acid export membrane protein